MYAMHERKDDGQNQGGARAKWGDGRIAFFALRVSIAADLASKVPMSRIHAKHKARLGISYRQFLRLVREFRDEAKEEKATLDLSPAPRTPSPPAAPQSEVRKPLYTGPPAQRTFHFDPMNAYRNDYGVEEKLDE